MTYRYTLRPVTENMQLGVRVINGVRLQMGVWAYSDTQLSFKGFENLVMEEKAEMKDGFTNKAHHVEVRIPPAPVPVKATRSVEHVEPAEPIEPVPVPAPEPVFEETSPHIFAEEPIEISTPRRQVKKDKKLVIYTDEQLRNYLTSKGFSMMELITYNQEQLYELLLIENSISSDLEIVGDYNGE